MTSVVSAVEITPGLTVAFKNSQLSRGAPLIPVGDAS